MNLYFLMQVFSLQLLISCISGSQSISSSMFAHCIYLICWPVPHGLEHSDHSDHLFLSSIFILNFKFQTFSNRNPKLPLLIIVLLFWFNLKQLSLQFLNWLNSSVHLRSFLKHILIRNCTEESHSPEHCDHWDQFE